MRCPECGSDKIILVAADVFTYEALEYKTDKTDVVQVTFSEPKLSFEKFYSLECDVCGFIINSSDFVKFELSKKDGGE